MSKLYFSHLMPDEEAIRLLKKYPDTGLEAIEFGIGYTLDRMKETEKEYRERVGEWTKNRHFSVHGPFLDLNPGSFDSLIAEATMKRFRQCYELADHFGADRIVFHSGFNPQTAYEEGWAEQSAGFWKKFLEPLDDHIQIHIENVLDLHAELLLKVVELADCDFFTACIDVGHVNAYSEETPEEFMKILGRRTGHLHLHNNYGKNDEHLPLDQGTIDMKKILQLKSELCPEASVTLEHSASSYVEESLSFLHNL